MAKLTVKTPLDFDLLAFVNRFQKLDDPFGDQVKDGDDRFSVKISDRYSLVVEGDFNAKQTKGAIDKLTVLDRGAAVLEGAGFDLSLAQFGVIEQTGGVGLMAHLLSEADQIFGNAGDDVLFSLAPARFFGGKGDDVFVDQLDQTNRFDGESGVDTLLYISNNTTQIGVTVSLADPSLNKEEAEGDTYRSIENVVGTDWDDVIIGSKVKNVLTGALGDDTLEGGAKADTLQGGKGKDFASYEHASASGENPAGAQLGVYASLADPSLNKGDAKGDAYNSIEGLIGSSLNDVLIGDRGANTIFGGFGDDTIDGGRGKDELWGDDTRFGVSFSDAFRFDTTNNGVKSIMDYDAFDRILIDRAGFGLKASYRLVDGQTFVSADDPTAGTKSPTFLFDRTSGEFLFDANGSKDGGIELLAKVKFDSQLYLDINDVFIVG